MTALIGPSGCGKSTFLRCINRMNDTIPIARVTGSIRLDDMDIYDPRIDVVELRARVGMVFQKPNPFPKSIFENVAYGPRIHGMTRSKAELEALVQSSLKRAGLWNEVKDRLHEPGTGLSGGQQQRLCIARAIATRPEVLLMDEPASALDPIATAIIEELIDELRTNYTIVIVTHSMQQAARVSQRTAFFHLGKLIEDGAHRGHLLQPAREADRGLHHRQDRLTYRSGASSRPDRRSSAFAKRRSSRRLIRGCVSDSRAARSKGDRRRVRSCTPTLPACRTPAPAASRAAFGCRRRSTPKARSIPAVVIFDPVVLP